MQISKMAAFDEFVKSHGFDALAKRIVEDGIPYGLSEHELSSLLKAHCHHNGLDFAKTFTFVRRTYASPCV